MWQHICIESARDIDVSTLAVSGCEVPRTPCVNLPSATGQAIPSCEALLRAGEAPGPAHTGSERTRKDSRGRLKPAGCAQRSPPSLRYEPAEVVVVGRVGRTRASEGNPCCLFKVSPA